MRQEPLIIHVYVSYCIVTRSTCLISTGILTLSSLQPALEALANSVDRYIYLEEKSLVSIFHFDPKLRIMNVCK